MVRTDHAKDVVRPVAPGQVPARAADALARAKAGPVAKPTVRRKRRVLWEGRSGIHWERTIAVVVAALLWPLIFAVAHYGMWLLDTLKYGGQG